jgi:hypothetical protein
MPFLPAVKKVDACNNERDEKNQTDEPSDDELDEPSFGFFGVGFQLADLRYRVVEVNLARAFDRPTTGFPAAKDHKQKLRRAAIDAEEEPDVFVLPLRRKYAK